MYLIDKKENRIKKIEKKKFSELGFKERQHLQEWIANNPESLGEELLIIQKEFSGFNDTNERLDLLALDKEGNLVIIENKLDDTGKDVTWQVLKYTSYCSTLKKEEIERIYQDYLDKQGIKSTAQQKLTDFFDISYDDLSINQTLSQRIFIIAANFKKEVTSTVMWLRNFKINVKCIKTTVYQMEEKLFLTFEQIIPTKDTEDYMISLADKTQEDICIQEGIKTRHQLRFEFWSEILALLKGETFIFQNTSPTKDHWINSGGAGITGARYSMLITQNYAGVNLEFGKQNKEENKKLFDELLKYQKEIEQKFGHSLEWERLDNNVSSRVSYLLKNVNITNKEDWDKIMKFLKNNIIKLANALKEPLNLIKQNTNLKDDLE